MTLKKSSLRIATWNINSVRLRLDLVKKLADERGIDVLCLQEIKCTNDQFPAKDIRKMGFEHIAVNGQKGYHGVATLSRIPLKKVSRRGFCDKGDARHIVTTLADDIDIHNFYVPAGGDVPDPTKNEKFDHKLNFLNEMAAWFGGKKSKKKNKLVLVGDLNIAPLESDVWSHKQLQKVVSHTPVEVAHLERVRQSHDWLDVTRRQIPEPQPVFTWWSYRSADWTKNDRGRRLDHIWVSPALAGRARNIEVVRGARSWPRPSDHAPVLMSLDL